jgi:hypothetical protein
VVTTPAAVKRRAKKSGWIKRSKRNMARVTGTICFRLIDLTDSSLINYRIIPDVAIGITDKQ